MDKDAGAGMSEVVAIGDATLYHGDCLEILPTLSDVACVVTSPALGSAGCINEPTGKWAESDGGGAWVRAVQDNGYSDDLPEEVYIKGQKTTYSRWLNTHSA